jgi:type II secretory pathway component PulC
MSSPSLFQILNYLRWVILSIALAAMVVFGILSRRLPELPDRVKQGTPSPEWVKPATIEPGQWRAFAKTSGATQGQESSPLAKRFRLAGTFFTYSDAGEGGDSANRRAIIDDLVKNQQYLVNEGQTIDEYEVARIFQERIVLRSGGAESELWLSFSDASSQTGAVPATQTAAAQQAVLESSRFGDRVGSNRWVMTRDAMLGYYRELLDDPERIAALYMSLKPKYQEEKITGYFLDVEGEGEFFKATGLQQGDVIRKVNSINMTSQKRAEYFIGEFVKNRANAFVLDIERGGKPEKLIYMIR